MTSREMKKQLKKLAIVLIFILVAMGILLTHVLGGKKAELSIYTNAKTIDNLQALGFKETELKEYLSIFGNLVDDQYSEDERILNMATSFIENMSSCEVKLNENGSKSYDAELVKKLVRELNGMPIKDHAQTNEIYEYQASQNSYLQKQEINRIAYCTEIREIAKKGEEIEIVYELAIFSKEQMASFLTQQKVDFETHTVKAVIMENLQQEYSKYFVSRIEEI